MAHHQLVVARGIDEVFDLVTTPEVQARWQPSIVEIERLGSGPFGLGSRVREVRSFLGHRVEAVWEVCAYEPSRRAAIRVVDGCVTGGASYALATVPGGTRVSLSVELVPRGAARLAARVVRPAAEAELLASCRRLRRILEEPACVA